MTDAIDALLKEIDRIARSYKFVEYGLPIIPEIISNHAAPMQAMREAVSRFVEEVKKEQPGELPGTTICPACGRLQMTGTGNYSCGKCGMGMIEPCEHFGRSMIADAKSAQKEIANEARAIQFSNDVSVGDMGSVARDISPSSNVESVSAEKIGRQVADAALPSAPQKCPHCGSEKKHQFVWNYSRHNGCTEDAYHEFHNGWEDSVPDAVPPAQREAEGAPETTLFGGRKMTESQIKYMVERFLGWRLPDNFNPDAGISFKRDFNEHTAHPMKHEPVGTNLFDAVQTEAMVRYLVDGMPQSQASECSAAPPTKAGMSVAVGRDSMGLWCSRCGTLRKPCQHFDVLGDVLAGADRSPDTDAEGKS